jgi:hypothetical protein
MHYPLYYPQLAYILAAVTALAVVAFAVWAYVYDKGHFEALANRMTVQPAVRPSAQPLPSGLAGAPEPEGVIELTAVLL